MITISCNPCLLWHFCNKNLQLLNSRVSLSQSICVSASINEIYENIIQNIIYRRCSTFRTAEINQSFLATPELSNCYLCKDFLLLSHLFGKVKLKLSESQKRWFCYFSNENKVMSHPLITHRISSLVDTGVSSNTHRYKNYDTQISEKLNRDFYLFMDSKICVCW